MKRILILIAMVLFSLSLKAQEITGTWMGTWNGGGVELEVVFHIVKSGDGYVTTMDSPNQGMKGIPVAETRFENKNLILSASAIGFTYSGVLSGENRIQGVAKQNDMSCVMELKRVSEQFIDDGKPSSVGSWIGTVTVQGIELKVVFHVTRIGNEYITAMDSPSQGVRGISVKETRWKEEELDLVIVPDQVVYTGKLREDGTINGTFKQMGQSFPLILSRVSKASELGKTDSVSLAGQWKGILKTEVGALPLQINVTKVGDEYVSAMDWISLGTKGYPVAITRFEGRKVTFEAPICEFMYTGELKESGRIEGMAKSSGSEFPMELSRAEGSGKVNRPQEPRGPFPYHVENVMFENQKDRVMLAGTLTLPKDGSDCPVVVLISGSGAQNRDEEIMEHKPFLVLADYLTRRGIGVLRVDDRGIGGSTGDPKKATTLTFASDVEAAVRFLRKERKMRNIGLIGHSEGGMIAPLVAGRDKGIRFIVLLAGTGVRGDQIIISQQEASCRAMGIAEEKWKRPSEINRMFFDIIQNSSSVEQARESLVQYVHGLSKSDSTLTEKELMQGVELCLVPWFYFFIKYDPVPALKKVKCPVLALNGSKDLQVLPELNLPGIRKGLEAAKNVHVTIKELPGLNHLFQECEKGTVSEYWSIEQTFSPVALDVIGDWILRVNGMKK